MVTFTVLAKILSLENYYNRKRTGLGENFILQKFLAIRHIIITYMYMHIPMITDLT